MKRSRVQFARVLNHTNSTWTEWVLSCYVHSHSTSFRGQLANNFKSIKIDIKIER